MSRAAAKFTQADVRRALKGAQDAGFDVGAIEIRPDGVMQIMRQTQPSASTVPIDPFEAWKASRDAR
ncbi:hypothetical protein RM53_00045 [Brevundimonas nasdae]|uniref:Uncharacterized protein n=1 Tax=Brevundimonas nasdae TaxID=172043 RepID=A0A0B4D2V5_9CAUL|nr:hypothetical protein [Brevundimonas nasdae]KIC61016.1 hypothetical protein RM53_00045 [Brevundimonas nasdae]